jgi:hypothetical protein
MTAYRIEYQPLAGALEKLDVQAVIDGVTDPWLTRPCAKWTAPRSG